MPVRRIAVTAIGTMILGFGCAGSRSFQSENSLKALKREAREQTESVGRFSREAVSDSEMLQGHSAQEYRDSVIP
jgi:hypothetical protein